MRTTCTGGTLDRMKTEFGHQFKAHEARDRLKHLLDQAESGGVAVVRRDKPVVVTSRDIIDDLVAAMAPLDIKAAVTRNSETGSTQFGFWLEAPPVHAIGEDLDEAEEQFLDALIDYAEDWYTELRHAPNHAPHRYLALRIAIFAGDREELRRVIFGED